MRNGVVFPHQFFIDPLSVYFKILTGYNVMYNVPWGLFL